MTNAGASYDAILFVSFGGPEGREEVMPFLENVLRGKNVPRERMLEVAEHYQHFGGVSPINAQNRALIEAVEQELRQAGSNLRIYWGNRNWKPLLPDALSEMQSAGVKKAIAFFTSAFSSYSGCRQYRENIEAARAEVGEGAPQVDKLRVFYNHPGFIEPMAERVSAALAGFTAEERASVRVLFTAHSIPMSMAANCKYEAQFREASRLVAERCGLDASQWQVVYQSRSGPPSQPWLEPDVGDALREIAATKATSNVVIAPIGFISDHMEVMYDLDYEAAAICKELGIKMVRAGTVGTHPRFVRMIRELIEERLAEAPNRLALGVNGPSHDVCPVDCCLYTPRPMARG